MRIHHTALYCLDLEATRDFFTRYYKATSNEMYHNPRTGLKTYILSFDGSDAELEIMTRPEIKVEEINIHRQGFIHISFAVGTKDEVDNLTIMLGNEGYEILSQPRTTGDGFYESCIIGPENIQIEITI